MRHGILIIDKAAGMTSHDVVNRARRILGTRRIGHAGTLDPFATGVLVLCINGATRLAPYLMAHEKEYVATIRFGYATDTGDLTGKPLVAADRRTRVRRDDLITVLEAFRGKMMQLPPMYSARKIGGVRLYELARKGQTVERTPKEIVVTDIELLSDEPVLEQEAGCRDFQVRVVCSAGTYIRTLAADIGEHLATGAHLRALRRTRSGRCDQTLSVSLEELSEAGQEAVRPPLEFLDMPVIEMTEQELERIAHGQDCVSTEDWSEGQLGALCSVSRELVAIGEYRGSARAWHPRAVISGALS